MEQKILPVFQVIIAAALMYMLAYFFPVFNYSLPFKNIILVILLSLSILVAFTAIYSFKKHKTTVNPTKPETTSVIVNTGIYAFSRNPMYLAMFIFLMAVSLFFENILAFIPLPLFIWFITVYQIIPEERVLKAHFKADYESYLMSVRRWI